MTATTTIRGIAASVQYLSLSGHSYRVAQSIDKADNLNLNVGGKNVALMKDSSLPLVNEGDDVEVTGVVNPRSGGLEVIALKNHTTGTEWKFSRARAVFGF